MSIIDNFHSVASIQSAGVIPPNYPQVIIMFGLFKKRESQADQAQKELPSALDRYS